MNDWLHSYFTDRVQSTQIGSEFSTKLATACGVPQGSVLGPLLFLLESIGIIARLRHFVPSGTLLTPCISLISPYLIYGLTVWDQAPQIDLNQILVLQKRALRLIYFAPYRSPAIPQFISSRCFPISLLYFQAVVDFNAWCL